MNVCIGVHGEVCGEPTTSQTLLCDKCYKEHKNTSARTKKKGGSHARNQIARS